MEYLLRFVPNENAQGSSADPYANMDRKQAGEYAWSKAGQAKCVCESEGEGLSGRSCDALRMDYWFVSLVIYDGPYISERHRTQTPVPPPTTPGLLRESMEQVCAHHDPMNKADLRRALSNALWRIVHASCRKTDCVVLVSELSDTGKTTLLGWLENLFPAEHTLPFPGREGALVT